MRIVRLIGVIFIVLTMMGCTSKSGEITVYPLRCTGSMKHGSCTGKWLPLNSTVYRVSEARQSVIYWMPDISESPNRLEKCVVRDVENWRCSYSDDSADLVMEGGSLSVHVNDFGNMAKTAKKHDHGTRYVSWFRYWITKLSWLLS